MNGFDWELFDRYLAGEATSAERERLERWLAERPERAAQAAAFRQAIDELDRDVPAGEREAMWEHIVDGPAEFAPTRRPTYRPAERSPVPRRAVGLAVAAAVALALGAALTVRSWRTRAGGERVAERIVSVPRAQQAQFRLPDGTTVVLGGGSTLHHPRAFDATRRVSLQGEAYFEVAHDARRPFQVLAGDLIATDLGTEFLVRAYPEDARARVVVRSGEIGLRAATSQDSTPGAMVRPGQVGRLGPQGVITVERADTAAYFAWTRGILVFDDTPLREALPQLSRWYDLDFRLADSSLGSVPLTGRLDRTLTDDRLELLASSLGLHQTRAGRVVTFSPAIGGNR